MFAFAIVLVVAGGFVALANWLTVFQSCRTRRFCSAVPLVGAVLLGTGMFMLPAVRFYGWSALVLDYGTLALLLAAPRIVRECWSTRRFNLVSEYSGQTEKKTVRLRLFKNGIFTVQLTVSRAANQCGLVNAGTTGTWHREGNRIQLCAQGESASFEVIPDPSTESLRQCLGFASWENQDEMSLAGLEFVRRQNHRRDDAK